jgi:hypothetical protein
MARLEMEENSVAATGRLGNLRRHLAPMRAAIIGGAAGLKSGCADD